MIGERLTQLAEATDGVITLSRGPPVDRMPRCPNSARTLWASLDPNNETHLVEFGQHRESIVDSASSNYIAAVVEKFGGFDELEVCS